MRKLEQHWYRSRKTFLTRSLLPLSWMFRGAVSARRWLYRVRILKSQKFSVPVIIVGNITVGGTGKTPFVIWLAQFLQKRGLRPGIVSRGVGGELKKHPRWVDANSDPRVVGDEAVLLAKRTGCPVVVGVKRTLAVQALLTKSQCDVIISDDGLQHYRLARNLEIALIDGVRDLGNKQFIPAGPLRESPRRLRDVDLVVRTQPNEDAHHDFVMQLQGEMLHSLRNDNFMPLKDFSSKSVHAVAAVGHPQRFFNRLREYGLNIIEHVFPDHYLYRAEDFAFGDELPILMTEKDAVKCQTFADERFWCLPVAAELGEEFERVLMEKMNEII